MPERGNDLPHYARDRFGKRYVLLEPEEPAARAARRIYALLLDDIVENLPGVRQCAAGLYLHDFRVATRRTRTGLRQLAGVHARTIADHFAAEFGWIAKSSNDARDLEVFGESLPRYREALGDDTIAGLEEFVGFLREQTAAQRAACAAAASSDRFERLLADWRRFLAGDDTLPAGVERRGAAPPDGQSAEGNRLAEGSGEPDSARAIRELAAARIRAAYDRVVERGGGVHAGSSGYEFHRLRLQCKKLRYLLEFFRSLFDARQGDDTVESLRALQDDLGYINDLRVQAIWLLRFLDPALVTEDRTIVAAIEELPDGTPGAVRDTLAYIERERLTLRERFLRDFVDFIAPAQRTSFEDFLASRPAAAP